jgi:glutathione peroxidase
VNARRLTVRHTGAMTDAANIYQLDFTANDGRQVSLSDYEGKPVLIVNTASKCGFTPQYEGLQELYEKYSDRGLVVLGFPCDQFAHQEPGSDEEIQQFCSRNYGVTFPLSAKIEVNGKNAHPVFEFVKKNSRSTLGSTIKWNFTKFLVAPDGKTVQRYSPQTKPEKLAGDIEQMLD